MKNFNKTLYKAFYPLLIISVIFYLIPGKYKIAVYGLNYLGWITVCFAFLTVALFLWLIVLDIRNKSLKKLFLRLTIFILALICCVTYSFYDHQKNENLSRNELKKAMDE